MEEKITISKNTLKSLLIGNIKYNTLHKSDLKFEISKTLVNEYFFDPYYKNYYKIEENESVEEGLDRIANDIINKVYIRSKT